MNETLTTEEVARASGGALVKEQALFADQELETYRARWDEIQAAFVDDPRRCVHRADGLVAETIQRLAEIFAQERQKLETQWSRGDEVSTEDLRVAMQRYRTFFNRLLEV